MTIQNPPEMPPIHLATLAFIGGGNMASAIMGGLLKSGLPASSIMVVEPFEPARAKLARDFGIQAQAEATTALASASTVVWAVKPQTFQAAAMQNAACFNRDALHLSVAAGIKSDSIAKWLNTDRVVRAMPNTPALVGQGMTGLFARMQTGQHRPSSPDDDASTTDCKTAEAVLHCTGQLMWLADEKQLDAVTAISGSGPAYVFYFLEALTAAGVAMGLSEAQAKQLAMQTFHGATQLAKASPESLAVLRERVTSKGGTTHAAIAHLQAAHVARGIEGAAHAACKRAAELGDEFGGGSGRA